MSQVVYQKQEPSGGQKLVARKRDKIRGYGTLGTPIKLYANHFLVAVPEKGYFYHYDVDMVFDKTPQGGGDGSDPQGVPGQGKAKKGGGRGPSGPAASAAGGAPAKFPKALKHRVMTLFLGKNGDFLNGSKPVYDGEKGLYSMKEFKIPTGQTCFTDIVIVPKDEEGGERRVKVAIQPCKPLCVSWKDLADAIAGLTDSVPIVVIQCINTVFRAAAMATVTNIAIRRSYFSRDMIAQPVELGGCRQMWTGFYSSVRPCQWKLTLNLDKAHTVFYKQQDLLTFLSEVLRAQPMKLSDHQRREFEKEIKGLKVETKHGGIRRARVTGLAREGPDQLSFDVDGKKTTVTAYFKNTYKIALKYAGLPCLKIGNKGSYMPIEVCTLMEQKCEKRLTESQTADMVRACTQTAPQRRQAVDRIRKETVKYDASPQLQEFGISVAKDMVKLDGRILPLPDIVQFDNKTTMVKAQDGTWDPRNVKFALPAALKNWIVVNLDSRTKEDEFIDQLVKMGNSKGMSVGWPDKKMVPQFNPRNPDFVGIIRDAKALFNERGQTLDLVMFILGQPDMYPDVKKAGDISQGIITQVVMAKTIFKNQGPKMAQLVGNILLKMNVKMGGQNSQVGNFGNVAVSKERVKQLARFCEKPTIVFGADVTHPSPGESKDKPSIAAVVASCYRFFTSYGARVRAQAHRAEIMTDLQEMVMELMQDFRARNRDCKPHRIIFYRDGVSEGQFEQVMVEELNALQVACKRLETGYEPQITYIIVGKRHHTRLFCADPRQQIGRGENVPPGTIVDKGICHFTEMDYFLCSHGGIQGTSRPAHYSVLYDDSDFSADEIELFSYYLTFCYARCNRSVSIPAPAYYAHHVAFRARHHLADSGFSETGSTPSSGPVRSAAALELNKKIAVHENLLKGDGKKAMYFV